ncbi:MAG: PAC2 family protein [Propioniciclava sp.]|uniref:PAC2 family protein n=1 Tax=Propioniciclava sp. TaxID=2038686 RepID=UPI0039E2BB4C
MLDPRSLYEVHTDVWESIAGSRPPMLHLLEGYVDAGHLAKQLSDHLLASLQHEVLVTFDHDQLHDYRSRRPAMVFDTNTWASLTDYQLAIHKVTDASGRVFLLLAGPEPDQQWNRACTAILDITRALEVPVLVTGQGVPMGVPHTRPTLVTSHATDPDLAADNPVWIDRVTVPGSFSAMLEYTTGQDGRLGRGFVAHVPHYLAQGNYVPGALAVLERIRDATGLDLPPGDLATLALQTLGQLEEEVNRDGEFGPLVTALEEQYDELRASGRPSVPSADEIGAAVERFLAEHQEGDDNGGGRGPHQ